MARHLISDHHFGHSNIIEYCDRPFHSAGEMNETMLDRYYESVTPDDTLIHLGDIAMDMQDGEETIERFHQLDADLLIRGNHDVGLCVDEAPFPVVESCVLKHGDHDFYCTHRPANIPDSWSGWAIHGHEHNNDTDRFPFINGAQKRINVSAELLAYKPQPLETLVALVESAEEHTHIRDVTEAQEQFNGVM